ncbi:hypothetical protein GDO81_019407 [Engystomops pustulosus]|uniref:Uncharacterized protein n=1 Tax=Engystomops pustulosus TaxID=76066 RepID=A0AAV6ZFP7_ENGPU|nr:hypothetical protein GDO81_019407 [Engystomops pustulosus]
MAAADLKAELICSICLEIYTDPINLPCGHNFCRECITKTWKQQLEAEYTCPECMKRYRRKPSLKSNRKIRNIADLFRQTPKDSDDTRLRCSYCIHRYVPAVKSCLHCEASLCDDHLTTHSRSPEHIMVEPTSSLFDKKCPLHKKVLEYYCTEDSICICAVCRINRKHKGHQVVTVKEASKRKQRSLKNIQKKLVKKRDMTERRLQSLLKEKERVVNKAAGETERVTTLFRDIRGHLEDLEKRVLSVISNWVEKASLPLSDLISEVKTRRDKVSENIGRIEELCSMDDPMKVLQEDGSVEHGYPDGDEEKGNDGERCKDMEELDEVLISLEIHKDLADIMKAVRRRLHD